MKLKNLNISTIISSCTSITSTATITLNNISETWVSTYNAMSMLIQCCRCHKSIAEESTYKIYIGKEEKILFICSSCQKKQKMLEEYYEQT